MAINLKIDLMGNPEPPSIVLANRNGNKLGQLDVDAKSIDGKELLKTSEFSFTLNKYTDGKLTNLWDKVVDFKLVYCPEWDLWYGIKVELDEATETVKTVFCTQLGQEELSQIKVYNTEINTEADIARDDYKISILYDEDNPDASILHRVMSKAPHYSIAYIDESLKRIQKSFSFDDASICDVFDEIEEEVGCLVVYNSNSDKNGMPKRDVSIYDLLQNCKNPHCKHRGEFTDKCPKCGSTDIDYGYGEDTTIFVTADELATEGIQLVTDTDSVKNCFKLEAGDDLMTATIRNCNPNGSDYIWYFSDAVKEDMSKELVEAIESYDSKYKEYYNSHTSNLDENLVSEYNALVEKYKEYYNTPSTCINCDYEGEFENECPSCHSGNILTGKSLQSIDTPITGYPALMNAYYNTIDLALYLESGLMPNVEMSDTKAEEQVKLLTASSLSPVAVNVEKIDNVSLATANSAVLSMAKVIVRPTYKVEISSSTFSNDKIWSGQFVVTNYSDETDTATSDTVNVTINNETEDFIKQKIEKALNKENTDDLSISGLFNEDKYDYDAFCAELKKYALNPLKSFYDACDACLNILTEQGAGDKDEKLDLYENLYEPYYKRSQAIAKEMKLREDEIAVIKGVYDETDEDNKVLITEGLQTNIEDCRKEIQDALNFEGCLGENLWIELCSYRREDKYSNSNYVSDGLNNAELFEKALEFVEVAENEIFKSAELQHSISATLNNLLAIPKFKPLVKYFKTGNWIRVQVDDRIFKLRLLEYDFSYSNLESIPVEFSDVTKIKNGTTDVKDIISQAASMASSYDSVQRQAKKGNVARSTIDQWLVDGLNSANVEIKNNNSEEVLITKNGLLARSYSDITGEYSPEQLKITHNIMAYTDDNWETVSSALGKHEYQKWKDNQWVTDTDYGLSSKFVTAGYVTGSQIIGGEIVSSNYKLGDEPKGTYINLIEGDFEFAGGKIVYDSQKNKVTLSGVTIQWDNVNKPTIENIDGLSGITEDIRAIEQGLQATIINGQYVISPHIVGGDLKIVSDDGTTSAQISNSGALTATGANITGDITATSLTLGNGVKISTENIDGIDDYAKISDIEGVPDNILTTDDVEISESTTENGVTTQKIIVGDNEYTSIISGDFVFTDIGLGTDTEDGSKRYTCIAKDGLLTAKNAIVYGTIYATDGRFTGDIVADSLTLRQQIQIGNEADGYHTWINPDGVLSTENANISGEIRAASGSIGGFNIKPNDIETGEVYGWLYSGETIGADKSIFLSATDMSGTIGTSDTQFFNKDNWRMAVGSNFGVTSDGTVHAVNAILGDCTITGGILQIGEEYDEDGNLAVHTWISEDGTLSTYNANINGTITAINGKIGGWQIEPQGLYTIGDYSTGMCSMDGVEFSSEGLTFTFNENTSSYIVSDCSQDVVQVKIPSTYEGYPVTSIGYQAFQNCTSLTSVIIEDGIVSIDSNAFVGCSNLTSVIIRDGLTSIGNWAFGNCYNLANIIIPNSLTSIGGYAFTRCHNLTNILIPINVTSISNSVFNECNTLTIYCEIDSQPSGWNSNWNPSDRPVVWDYERSYNHPSLVGTDATSTVRIFAGSDSRGVPDALTHSNFLLLEDGSLYANAAQITGGITATSGKIGNCTIATDGSITSANGEFHVDNTGSIVIASADGDELTKIQQGIIRSSTFIMEKIQDINRTDVLTLNHSETQLMSLSISGMFQGGARTLGFYVLRAEDGSRTMLLDNIRIKATFTYSYYSVQDGELKTETCTDKICRIDGDYCELVGYHYDYVSATQISSCSFTFIDPLPNESSVRSNVYSYGYNPDTFEYFGDYEFDIAYSVVSGLCVNTDLVAQKKILPQSSDSTLGAVGSVWNTIYADSISDSNGNTITIAELIAKLNN